MHAKKLNLHLKQISTPTITYSVIKLRYEILQFLQLINENQRIAKRLNAFIVKVRKTMIEYTNDFKIAQFYDK